MWNGCWILKAVCEKTSALKWVASFKMLHSIPYALKSVLALLCVTFSINRWTSIYVRCIFRVYLLVLIHVAYSYTEVLKKSLLWIAVVCIALKNSTKGFLKEVESVCNRLLGETFDGRTPHSTVDGSLEWWLNALVRSTKRSICIP